MIGLGRHQRNELDMDKAMEKGGPTEGHFRIRKVYLIIPSSERHVFSLLRLTTSSTRATEHMRTGAVGLTRIKV